ETERAPRQRRAGELPDQAAAGVEQQHGERVAEPDPAGSLQDAGEPRQPHRLVDRRGVEDQPRPVGADSRHRAPAARPRRNEMRKPALIALFLSFAASCGLLAPVRIDTQKEILSQTPADLPRAKTRPASLLILAPQADR